MFCGSNQHDAQEFLKAILEGIHEEVNRITVKPAYKELKAESGTSLQLIVREYL